MPMMIKQNFSRSKCLLKFHKVFKFYTYTILLILYLRRTDSGRHSTLPSGKVWTYLCTTVRGRQLFTMNVITPSFGSLVTLFNSREVYLHVRKWYSILSLIFGFIIQIFNYKSNFSFINTSYLGIVKLWQTVFVSGSHFLEMNSSSTTSSRYWVVVLVMVILLHSLLNWSRTSK